jgi:hypothetical protein
VNANYHEALRRAGDFLTPQNDLRTLAERPEEAVWLAIIRNHNCPPDLRVALRRKLKPEFSELSEPVTRARERVEPSQQTLFD